MEMEEDLSKKTSTELELLLQKAQAKEEIIRCELAKKRKRLFELDKGIVDDEVRKMMSEEATKMVDKLINYYLTTDPKWMDKMEFYTQDNIQFLSQFSPGQQRVYGDIFVKELNSRKDCPSALKEWADVLSPGMMLGFGGQNIPTQAQDKLAKELANELKETLHKDVVEAVEHSLRWRPYSQLKKLEYVLKKEKKKPKKKRKVKFTGRESCLFLEVDNDITYVG